MSGPGVVSGKAEARQHLVGPQPAVRFHRLLRHVGEHRIGAAEGDHGHLGEEQRFLREHMPEAQSGNEHGYRSEPDGAPDEDRAHRLRPWGPRRRRRCNFGGGPLL
jgi:hypothetical protein